MAKTISTASPRDTLRTVAELMKREDAGFMPICEGKSLVGVITDRDIVLRGLAGGDGFSADQPAERYMSRDIATISPDAGLEEAAHLMNQREIRRLPVVQNGQIVGVLSHGNLVQAMHSEGPADEATLGVTRGA
jgi:CBS domain-containing protein